MTDKHWPARETMKIAAGSHKSASAGNHRDCIPVYVDLLREHQKYMLPFGKRWTRTEDTIKNLEAQL